MEEKRRKAMKASDLAWLMLWAAGVWVAVLFIEAVTQGDDPYAPYAAHAPYATMPAGKGR